MKLDDHARDVVRRAFFDGQLDDGLSRLLGRLVIFAKRDGLVVGDRVPHSVAGYDQVLVEWPEDVPDCVGLACHAKALVGEVAERTCYRKAACHSSVHYFTAR